MTDTDMTRKRITMRRLSHVGAALALAGALAACSVGGGIGVQGVEYGFEKKLPTSLVRGEHSFRFHNHGKEPHEMVVVRLPNGVGSINQVLALPQQEARAKLEMVGSTRAAPGAKGDKVTANLSAGTYALVCFLPVGENGPPHFTRGMVHEFTVR